MSEKTHNDAHDDDHHHEHFIVPAKYYVLNAIAITILMFLTVLAAKWPPMHIGTSINGINLVIALAIAIAKTGCIAAIFMGVWWNSPIVKVFAMGVIVWLLILFSFFLVDYASPNWGLGTPYRDYNKPGAPALPDAAPAQKFVDLSGFGHGGDHGAAAGHEGADDAEGEAEEHH